MSLQDLIAPYLNRFVILFSENATAKLELSCAEGKVHVNMFYDLVAPKQNLPTAPPVKKAGYSDSLKKNLKTSQLNRLKRRAAVRAEEAETHTVRQNQMAEKAVEEAAKAVHAPEQHNVEAAKKNIEVQAANGEAKEAEAEKGPCDWDYAATEKLWLLQIQITGKNLMLSDVPSAGYAMEKGENFQNHQKEDWAEKTKCQLCGNKLNCMALKKHMKHIHGKDFPWIVKEW